MEKLTFIGAEEKVSAKGNTYYMLHFGKPIQKGIGVYPMSSRINRDMFEEFKELDTGVQFLANYQCIKDEFKHLNYIIQGYSI